jgi:hypothetical protein
MEEKKTQKIGRRKKKIQKHKEEKIEGKTWNIKRKKNIFPVSTFCSNKEKLTNTDRKKRTKWEEKKKGKVGKKRRD